MTHFVLKNLVLDPDPDWIRFQQEPGSAKYLDPDPKQCLEIVKCRILDRVRRGYVVSAPGCCTAAPGSNPARHPSLGSAQEIQEQESYGADFSSAAAGDTSAAAGVSAHHQG